MKKTVSVEIEIRCYDCEGSLTGEWINDRLEVHPCDKCIQEEIASAIEAREDAAGGGQEGRAG